MKELLFFSRTFNIYQMTKYLNFILLSILFIYGCSETKNAAPPKPLTVTDLSSLVLKAINGNIKANDSLSGLIDLAQFEHEVYNTLKVDSFNVDTLKYFYVLIEYPNSIYNRLSFYDEKTNCYLIDKSLNGNLSIDILEIHNLTLLRLVEYFIAKDTLEVKRLSLYKNVGGAVKLVYRSFAELKMPKQVFIQTITSISEDTIKTNLTVPPKVKVASLQDIFFFDNITNNYKSNFSMFDSLVIKEINAFESEIQKPNI